VAFPPVFLTRTLGEILSELGLRQLHVAETEKYAHVTFFFNGGREVPWPGEERILVPSPRDVPTYDKKPEMSAREITDRTVAALRDGGFSFVVMNYANADMVGHSGNLNATRQAVEVLDECLGKVVPAAFEAGFAVLITADHGNADKMFEEDGSVHTAHTTNWVPFIVAGVAGVDGDVGGGSGRTGIKLRKDGRLADIAPTILQLMGIPAPKEWDGVSLIRA
jgi:2,3-bisphosphoglycerate-independent phosphoglycerate mutase